MYGHPKVNVRNWEIEASCHVWYCSSTVTVYTKLSIAFCDQNSMDESKKIGTCVGN